MILSRSRIDILIAELALPNDPHEADDAAYYLLEKVKDLWRRANLSKSIYVRQTQEQGKRKSQP